MRKVILLASGVPAVLALLGAGYYFWQRAEQRAPESAESKEVVCPPGATENPKTPLHSMEAWCETVKDGMTVMHGPFRAWWPNGKLRKQGQLSFGKMTGRWRAWYENGNLQADELFDEGKPLKRRLLDKNGHETAGDD